MYLDMAKGDLWRSKKLTEEEAFKLIQRQSIDFRKSMRKKAEAVLLVGEHDQLVEKHGGNRRIVDCSGTGVKESPGASVWKAHRVSVHFVQPPAQLTAV
jgi:hypothetical protein